MSEQRWTITVCPECWALENDPPSYCDNCENGGQLRTIEVVPASEVDRLTRELEGYKERLTPERPCEFACETIDGFWYLAEPEVFERLNRLEQHAEFLRGSNAKLRASREESWERAESAERLADELAEALKAITAYPTHTHPGRPAVSYEHLNIETHERALAALDSYHRHREGR